MTCRARRKTTSSILPRARTSMSAVASRREVRLRMLAACSHWARRLAYSPPVSSCLTLVLMMSSALEGSVIGTNSGLPGTAVEQQQMVLLAHHGDELVHDAAGHAGVVVLGLLAEQRFVHRVELLARDGFQQGGGGRLPAPRCWTGRPPAGRWSESRRQTRPASRRAPGSRRSRRPGSWTTRPSGRVSAAGSDRGWPPRRPPSSAVGFFAPCWPARRR